MSETDPPAAEAPLAARVAAPNDMLAVEVMLLSRLGLLILAFLSRALIQLPHEAPAIFPGNLFFESWAQFDATWYLKIAHRGYTNTDEVRGQRDTGFFPLYPLAVRGVGRLIAATGAGTLSEDIDVAGLLVSNACFVVAGVLLQRLVLRRFGAEAALRAIVLMAVWPFAYVYSAAYAESLLVLASVAAFLAAENGWWLTAAIAAAAAGATRPLGVAVAPALGLLYLAKVDWQWSRVRMDALWLLIGLAGTAGFGLFLWIRFGSPMWYMRAQAAPDWGGLNSWKVLKETWNVMATADFGKLASGVVPMEIWLHAAAVVIALPLLIACWWKLPAGYSVYATLTFIVSLLHWQSAGRQLAVIFPMYIVAALLVRGRAFGAVVYLMTLWLSLVTILYTQSIWVG